MIVNALVAIRAHLSLPHFTDRQTKVLHEFSSFSSSCGYAGGSQDESKSLSLITELIFV